MSEPDFAVLARLETDRILALFPAGISLVDVGACLAVAAIAFRAQSEKNPHPVPKAVSELCELIEQILAEIATVRPSVANQRH